MEDAAAPRAPDGTGTDVSAGSPHWVESRIPPLTAADKFAGWRVAVQPFELGNLAHAIRTWALVRLCDDRSRFSCVFIPASFPAFFRRRRMRRCQAFYFALPRQIGRAGVTRPFEASDARAAAQLSKRPQ